MAFAIERLAEWTGQTPDELPDSFSTDTDQGLQSYRNLLVGDWMPTQPGGPLLSIFSRVRPEGSVEPPQRYWRPATLSLAPVEPVEETQARVADLAALWRGFAKELTQLLELYEDETLRFKVFTHLLQKWAWAVPCSYGEPGISLYDEFRALSALMHASGCAEKPANKFSLVGGDVPGIQKTIYTITSKGAAKGLRGRSFFIQLLSDAVVRRLLDDLGLPDANVIYVAGGNFMLLAPAGTEETISQSAAQINEQLLAVFEGDLAFCVVCQPLPATQIGSAAFAQKTSRTLHEKLGQEKRRRFAEIARSAKGWKDVFGPQGQGGGRFCAVCQHERQAGERGKPIEDGWKCDRCAGFEELAQTIAQDRLLMFVSSKRPGPSGQNWQELLWQLTRWWYDFGPDLKKDRPPGVVVYSLNHLDFLGECAHGFRFLANTTPRKANGQVKTFEDLAEGATGLKRVGVLRMDVDDLGRVLTRRMPERTMAATSALSNALDRFFTGWLDAICREVTEAPQMKGLGAKCSDLLYVIYAGGDDLFVVGAWDLMPLLAERIHRRFGEYVGHNPNLHISAGITLEDRKFPLYQAAERAGGALDHSAKELTRQVKGQQVKKDALSFLGLAFGWETYPFVKKQVKNLIRLTQEQKVPRSLLSVLRAIHAHYLEDVKRATKRGLSGEKIYYGPWMWRKVYQLSRIQRRCNEQEIAQAIEALEAEVLKLENMPYIGLATRWAEYLTREGRK